MHWEKVKRGAGKKMILYYIKNVRNFFYAAVFHCSTYCDALDSHSKSSSIDIIMVFDFDRFEQSPTLPAVTETNFRMVLYTCSAYPENRHLVFIELDTADYGMEVGCTISC